MQAQKASNLIYFCNPNSHTNDHHTLSLAQPIKGTHFQSKKESGSKEKLCQNLSKTIGNHCNSTYNFHYFIHFPYAITLFLCPQLLYHMNKPRTDQKNHLNSSHTSQKIHSKVVIWKRFCIRTKKNSSEHSCPYRSWFPEKLLPVRYDYTPFSKILYSIRTALPRCHISKSLLAIG